MKILIVTQYFWPESFRINDLALGLKERGHEVTVFTGKPNYPAGKFSEGYSFFNKGTEMWNGIKVIRAPLIPRGKGGGVRLFLNFISFAFFGALKAYFLKIKTDAIFVFEPSPITVGVPAIVLKRKTKARMAIWVQDLWPHVLTVSGGIKSQKVIKYADKFTRWVYSKCDKVLVQSHGFTEYLLQQNVPASKIMYYPNAGDKGFAPMARKPEYQQYFTSKYNLVFTGNIGESQAFDTLLKAAVLIKAENKDICWVIVGDGRMKDYVAGKVVEYGLQDNFKLIGRFPLEAMPYFYAYADALIMPLKNDPAISSTLPSKLQSYMACGKPIIGCIDGEGAKVIRDANCGLVAAGEDEKDLCKQVLHFFSLTGDERKVLGENSLSYYKKEFDLDSLIDKLITIISG